MESLLFVNRGERTGPIPGVNTVKIFGGCEVPACDIAASFAAFPNPNCTVANYPRSLS